MPDDTHDDLREQFPTVFERAWDVSVPPGWSPLVARLIERILSALGSENRDQFRISQAKEKFAELRVTHIGDAEVSSLFEEAVAESRRTCQVCGRPGHRRNLGGWVAALCDDDFAKEGAR